MFPKAQFPPNDQPQGPAMPQHFTPTPHCPQEKLPVAYDLVSETSLPGELPADKSLPGSPSHAPGQSLPFPPFRTADYLKPRQLELTLSVSIRPSSRVAQVAGMFDLNPAEHTTRHIRVTFGPVPPDWRIGLIVGPSGSGKSTLAKALFGPWLYRGHSWPDDLPIIEALGPAPLKQVARLLTAVGLSSPPTWLRPYRLLSTGEKFRCDLARALLEATTPADRSSAGQPVQSHLLPPPNDELPLVVFDEFTSVVDRTVAQAVAAALARAIRRGLLPCRFVAVTCHYDVLPWLGPDWMLDMATGSFHQPKTDRPPITLELFRAKASAWTLFSPHHYLSGKLSPAAQCFLAAWQGRPVCFCAVLPQAGRPGWRRISRLVTLPEYQGLGIGSAVLGALADWLLQHRLRTSITTSHPAMIAFLRRSPHWRITRVATVGKNFRRRSSLPSGRRVVSAEYWPLTTS